MSGVIRLANYPRQFAQSATGHDSEGEGEGKGRGGMKAEMKMCVEWMDG